jgi:hypothetical protein
MSQQVKIVSQLKLLAIFSIYRDIFGAKTQRDQNHPKRAHRPHTWIQDYETSYAYIGEQGQPYHKACQSTNSSHYRVALEEEIEAMHKNKTWKLVELLKGRKLLVVVINKHKIKDQSPT